MLADLCVCQVVPRRMTRTRLVLIMHHIEARRQSNTGRLALSALEHAEILLRGRPDQALDLSRLIDPARRLLLLFPSPEAELLDEAYVARDDRPVTLIVPDGTWNLARKIPLRQPELRPLPRVRLGLEEPSAYRLRHSPHPDKLSTLEAIARALGVLEGPELRQDLETLFQVARDRILWSQGKLREELVAGGLPFRARPWAAKA
jgi:DTW domain-containing protein YfiP